MNVAMLIQLSYESAKEVVLEDLCNEVLPEIFTYDPLLEKDDTQLKRLQDISNAFGLLLCHFRDIPSEKTHQKLLKKVCYPLIYKTLILFPCSLKVKIKDI